MQLMSKNQMLENYAEEIEKLNQRLKVQGGDQNSKLPLTQSTLPRSITTSTT